MGEAYGGNLLNEILFVYHFYHYTVTLYFRYSFMPKRIISCAKNILIGLRRTFFVWSRRSLLGYVAQKVFLRNRPSFFSFVKSFLYSTNDLSLSLSKPSATPFLFSSRDLLASSALLICYLISSKINSFPSGAKMRIIRWSLRSFYLF